MWRHRPEDAARIEASLANPAARDILAELLDNPGSRRLRRLRYRPDTWGVPIRVGDVRRLILWRPSDSDPDLIEVHYVGPAPGEP
jgi:hypothetical protein